MADVLFRHPSNTAVAQVDTFTITGVSTSTTATWTWTLTLDDGTTVTASYTEDGSPTIAEIVTGLKDAWNNSTNPHMERITATEDSGTDVILTADTAGVPFSVTLADDDDGTHSKASTTANVGNTDYGTARNWSSDAVPTGSDNVEIPAGDVDLHYGLDQSGVAIADFHVEKECKSDIGRFDNGKGYYLRIDPDAFEYRGRGDFGLFDIGSANISGIIESHGSRSSSRRHNIYFKGSNVATLEVLKGNVGIAMLLGDTATVDTIVCGFLESVQGDVDLTVGSGVTLTNLDQTGGRCLLRCAATTVKVFSNTELTTEGTGAITTLSVWGTAYPKSTGTITTLNCHGTVDMTRDHDAKTISTVNGKAGGKLIVHENVTITTLNPPTTPGVFTIEYR